MSKREILFETEKRNGNSLAIAKNIGVAPSTLTYNIFLFVENDSPKPLFGGNNLDKIEKQFAVVESLFNRDLLKI